MYKSIVLFLCRFSTHLIVVNILDIKQNIMLKAFKKGRRFMTKKQLLELGLTEEQAEKVLNANQEQLKGFVEKSKFEEVESEKKKGFVKKYSKEILLLLIDVTEIRI